VTHGKRVAQACTIGLSINENLKLEKGKEKNSSAVRRFMRSSSHVSSRDYVYYNPLFSTSAVILPPSLYIHIIPIGRFYLYILLVAYYLYYTSTLPTYLGTLAV
jgi:hypothetical protein